MLRTLLLFFALPVLAKAVDLPTRAFYDGDDFAFHFIGSNQTSSALFRSGEEIGTGATVFDIAPIVFFDFYKEHFITRETVSKNLDALEYIESPRATGRYQVLKRTKLQGGVGPAIVATLANRPIFNIVRPYIGLAPIKGVDSVSLRYSSNLQSAEELGALAVPKSTDTIERGWKTGDSLTYSVTGGAYFVAGISAFFLSTGSHYVVKGDFETTIAKLDADMVEVTLSKTDMKSLGVMNSTVLSSVNTSRFKEETLRFSYRYDLRNPVARKALQNLLAGDIQSSQVMAQDGEGAGVYPSSRETLRTTGKMRNISLGIPFLFWTNWGKGHVRTLRFKEAYDEGAEIDVEIGLFLKTKEKRHIMTKIMETTAFYGTQGIELTGSGQIIRRMQGMLTHSFRRSKATRRQLENALEELRQKTGMIREFTFDLPDERRLGALDMKFNMLINENLTTKLLELATQKSGKENLTGLALSLSESYGKNLYETANSISGDKMGLCQNAREVSSCLYQAKKDVKDSMEEAWEALTAMSQTYRSDRKKFVEAYAKFGQAWLDSPFTFQTFLGLLKGEELRATLEIATSTTNKLFISYEW